jgi:hypothetical protein
MQIDESNNPLREPHARDLSLRNRNCIYCCLPLTGKKRTREHVIGRNFTPQGTLDANLVAWACIECNNDKSNLEDDISVISMLPPVSRNAAANEWSATIGRKLRHAISRRTGKLVRDSTEKLTVKGELFPGFSMSFEMISNPQTDSERVGRLALYHVTAFHYFTTYNKETRVGEAIYGQFAVAGNYRRADWGNERARQFMRDTRAWDARFLMKGKDAFFKAIIRRRLPDLIWSWALEWNQSFRVFGFYGDQTLAVGALANLPFLRTMPLASGPNGFIRMREEVALGEADDILFDHDIPFPP